ncbi:hypothetical protein ABW20_dc0107737 [Dactylellina cionopaga]|nr:hypothetical protein ABW20_dc0107737 [Dactylellina cionopaga]
MESAISTALDKWARISNFTFTMDASNPNVTVTVINADDPPEDAFQDGFTMGYSGIGPDYQTTGYVKLNNTPNGGGPEKWTATGISNLCLHEWGHVLGLNHVEDSGAIMAPSIQNMHNDRELTDTDLNAFASLYGTSSNQPQQNQESQSLQERDRNQYRGYRRSQYPPNQYRQYQSAPNQHQSPNRRRSPENNVLMNTELQVGRHWKRYIRPNR